MNNNEVKYNVKTVLNINNKKNGDIVKIFNKKLLRVILNIEKNNCQ